MELMQRRTQKELRRCRGFLKADELEMNLKRNHDKACRYAQNIYALTMLKKKESK